MTDQPKPITRPWRRFLRFSVRGMIALVLLIGGWLGWIVRDASVQREAVAAIKRAGGLPVYQWENIVRDGVRPPANLGRRVGSSICSGSTILVTSKRRYSLMAQLTRRLHSSRGLTSSND